MLHVDAGVNMMTNRWPHDEYPANQFSRNRLYYQFSSEKWLPASKPHKKNLQPVEQNLFTSNTGFISLTLCKVNTSSVTG